MCVCVIFWCVYCIIIIYVHSFSFCSHLLKFTFKSTFILQSLIYCTIPKRWHLENLKFILFQQVVICYRQNFVLIWSPWRNNLFYIYITIITIYVVFYVKIKYFIVIVIVIVMDTLDTIFKILSLGYHMSHTESLSLLFIFCIVFVNFGNCKYRNSNRILNTC